MGNGIYFLWFCLVHEVMNYCIFSAVNTLSYKSNFVVSTLFAVVRHSDEHFLVLHMYGTSTWRCKWWICMIANMSIIPQILSALTQLHWRFYAVCLTPIVPWSIDNNVWGATNTIMFQEYSVVVWWGRIIESCPKHPFRGIKWNQYSQWIIATAKVHDLCNKKLFTSR